MCRATLLAWVTLITQPRECNYKICLLFTAGVIEQYQMPKNINESRRTTMFCSLNADKHPTTWCYLSDCRLVLESQRQRHYFTVLLLFMRGICAIIMLAMAGRKNVRIKVTHARNHSSYNLQCYESSNCINVQEYSRRKSQSSSWVQATVHPQPQVHGMCRMMA